MAGKLPPDTMNPAPVIESELIVNAAVPLEVSVTDLVTAVPTDTFPNASDVVLSVRAGVAAFSCKAKLFEMEFALADTVAVCDVLTEATVAVNEAVLAPDATVTLAGTVTALVLLARLTLCPADGAGALRLTEQDVEPVPVNELVEHDNPLNETVTLEPDPLRLIVVLFETDP